MLGIELSPGFRGNKGQYENWFLNSEGDCRASNQLEVAASQFECQGLELDWGGLCWGEDFLGNLMEAGATPGSMVHLVDKCRAR